MKRRSFFKNLVGSVAVLVTAYAKPFQRVILKRESDPVHDFIISESGRISETLQLRTFSSSPWIGLIRGKFPQSMGDTQREVKS